MPTPEESSEVPLHADGHSLVHAHLACANCGYNLRGLPVTGVCPECAWPIRNSHYPDSPYRSRDYASDTHTIATAQQLQQAGLPAILQALASGAIYQRKAAAYALGQAGSAAAAALGPLTAALGDRNSDVRWWAAFALGQAGPAARPAVPALQALLSDPDEEVAAAAEEALRKISNQASQHDSRPAEAADAPGTDDYFPRPLVADPNLAPWMPSPTPRPPAPPPPGHPHHQVMPPPAGPVLGATPRAPSWAAWGSNRDADLAQKDAGETGEAPMKWEYKTVTMNTHGLFGGKVDAGEVDEALNKLGWEGWEMIAAFDTNQHQGGTRHMVFIFKRPMSR